MHDILRYISIHVLLLVFFFFWYGINTKEAISTYDKYYIIKDDGVAKLGQLHFYSLEISFCIQTSWSHSLQIIVNSAMASHGAVCNSFKHTVLYSVFILYALHIILHHSLFNYTTDYV